MLNKAYLCTLCLGHKNRLLNRLPFLVKYQRFINYLVAKISRQASSCEQFLHLLQTKPMGFDRFSNLAADAVQHIRMLRDKVNDHADTALLQPVSKTFQSFSRIIEVVKGHADDHNIEVEKFGTGKLSRRIVREEIAFLCSHFVRETSPLGIFVVFVNHVVRDIQANDLGHKRSQSLCM